MTNAQDRLAAMRAAYNAGKRTPDQTDRQQSTNNYYPFWNMKPGQRAVIRFIPDANENNPYSFLLPKPSHTFVINGEEKKIPCLKMYKDPEGNPEDCPACKVSRDFYSKQDKVNGKKYYRSMQHLAQALIIEDPLPADPTTGETHQGKLRNIAVGYQLHSIIRDAITNEDEPLDNPPEAFEGGYDFVIRKTEQGEYSTYAMGSKFMNRPRDLTEEELAVAMEGQKDLSTLLPRHPGLERMAALLNAALTGGVLQDEDETEERAPAKTVPPKAVQPAKQAKVDVDVQPTSEVTGGSADMDSVIAAIQARRKAAGTK